MRIRVIFMNHEKLEFTAMHSQNFVVLQFVRRKTDTWRRTNVLQLFVVAVALHLFSFAISLFISLFLSSLFRDQTWLYIIVIASRCSPMLR